MKKILVVVDMQNDFVDGALGSSEGVEIIPALVEKIRDFEGKIFVTLDTHSEDYMNTAEGKKLPVPHCIKGTEGWRLDARVAAALEEKDFTEVEKPTFGSTLLPRLIEQYADGEDFSVELAGRCTDICVVSNALIIKANFPEMPMSVDSSCCAGVTADLHDCALKIMQSCQIEIK